MDNFETRLAALAQSQHQLLTQPNAALPAHNGLFKRYRHPIITAAHVPIGWRYDLNPATNPFLMERLGVNATFNAGAMAWGDGVVLATRVEGYDRKSFFAIAESPNGIDNFKFWDYPLHIPEASEPDTNLYDMRLVAHEDGWVYGLFCTERRDVAAPQSDQSAAVAKCGIARSKDLVVWERLPDLISRSGQQRNVVLHPEFVDGRYALYTRPQDGFVDTGTGGGIGWGLVDDMARAETHDEKIMEHKVYHTIKEVKNGLGPAPLKTPEGWLHLAHGVRNTAAGLRYVLYLFMASLDDPSEVTHRPGGYFMAPEGDERVGDVSNVLFCNGWVLRPDGQVMVYYASSDTRMHVATTTLGQLLDYVKNTPPDGLRTSESVAARMALIKKNHDFQRQSQQATHQP